MEKGNNRKLLQLYDPDADFSPSSRVHNEPISPVQNATSASPSSKIRAPLDSSMALTVLVLMTALVFMGFFSIYIRRFAGDLTAGNASDHRTSRRSNGNNRGGHNRQSPRGWSDLSKGMDPEAVRSLPVRRYGQEVADKFRDCPICLTEFEEGESVKVMPGCTHAFHALCVDAWLSSHGSCPVCRNTHLTVDWSGRGGRWTAENFDTSLELEAGCGVRRVGSCSRLEEQRRGLQRTWSF